MKLPVGWTSACIGELCNLINGMAFKPSDWSVSGLPIIRIQNLNRPDAEFNYFDGPVADKFVVEPGELLFAWSGTPGTSFGAHIWIGKRAVLNQHIFRVRFEEGDIDKSFFKLAINAKLDELIGKAHGGVGLAHVTKGKFEQTEIVLPPLTEQRRIVAKLDALFARLARSRAELDRAMRLSARIRRAALNELFAKFPKECFERLDDVCRIGTGSTPKRGEPRYYEQGTIPWVTSGVVNQRIVSEPTELITKTALKETNCKVFPAGSLVVALYGEGKTRGKVARLAIDAATNQALAALHSFDKRIDPEWIALFLEARYQETREEAAGGVQPNLNLGIIKAIRLPVPALHEQQAAVRDMKKGFARADRLEAEAARARALLERLVAAILTKAFKGELVPQDPNDEPASVLLERIRAQRAAAAPTSKTKRGMRLSSVSG